MPPLETTAAVGKPHLARGLWFRCNTQYALHLSDKGASLN